MEDKKGNAKEIWNREKGPLTEVSHMADPKVRGFNIEIEELKYNYYIEYNIINESICEMWTSRNNIDTNKNNEEYEKEIFSNNFLYIDADERIKQVKEHVENKGGKFEEIKDYNPYIHEGIFTKNDF